MLDKDLFIDTEPHESISLESLTINHEVYFRKYGVRRIGQLSAPLLINLSKIILPINSVLHYLPEDEGDLGISQNNILLRDIQRITYVEHISELTCKEGTPRKSFAQPAKLTREYLRRNRKTRTLTSLSKVGQDTKTLIIQNYSQLNHLWIYREHPMSFYWRCKNTLTTMWDNVSSINKILPERDHYLPMTLPKIIPSLSDFKRASANPTKINLTAFHDNDSLFLLDIWNWLGPDRDTSALKNVSAQAIAKINLVFMDGGVWTVLNLGLLNDWRKAEEDEIKLQNKTPTLVDGTLLQRLFLRYITTIFEYKNKGEKTNSPIVEAADSELAKEPEPTLVTEAPVITDAEKALEKDRRLSLDRITNPKPRETEPEFIMKADANAKRNEKINLVTTVPSKDTVSKLDTELDTLDKHFTKDADAQIQQTINALPPLERGIMSKADQLAEEGLISAAQYRRIETLSSKYKEIPNPLGTGTLETLATVTAADTAMPEIEDFPDDAAIFDKSMLKSNIEDIDRKYNEILLEKDVAATVLNIQKAGIAVTKYEIDKTEDAMNEYNAYTVRLAPVNGNPSVIRFRLPIIQEDGSYLVNGVKCQLRKQRVDIPIRKINSSKVALTSYYSKLFVTRSERAVNNYEQWLMKQFVIKIHDIKPIIKNVSFSNKWNNNFIAPRIYSIIAKRYGSFDIAGVSFFFDYSLRNEFFGEAVVNKVETEGRVIVGKSSKGIIVVDNADRFIEISNGKENDLGYITDILGIAIEKSPIELAEINVLNEEIPVGVLLSYLLGFDTLIKLTKVKERRIMTGERIKLEPHEFALKFVDETIIFNKRDKFSTMIFGGFTIFKEALKNYSVSAFNRKDIYYNLLEVKGISLRYIREMDLLNDMYIDPITEGILKDMGEPTEFAQLVLRATEMLLNDWSPDESDMRYQRIRGYERFSGFVYQELVRSVRQYNASSAAITASIEMHPEAVWRAIDVDVSKYLIQESNPIHNLKERETVTFAGAGGRSPETLVKRSRLFHKHDIGVISEATPDNKTVGAVTYLTPNPVFNSIRGTIKHIDSKDVKPSSLLSTAALISPGSDTDSPARINFINIQHSAGISAKGYRAMPLRTGYEKVMGHRVSDMFAYTAKDNGKIVSLENDHITVEYKNGMKKTILIGRRFGIVEGSVIPHSLITDLKVGDSVKRGDAIAYNENYFEPDYFNPKNINWKLGVLAKTVLLESTDTLEDSSAISKKLAEEMSTKITKVRNIIVTFDQFINNVVKVGSSVDISSILCTIEDPVTAKNQLFDDKSLDTLKMFSANTPKAKYTGVIERIEVFYNGDKSDMSDSLRALADSSDKALKRVCTIKEKENTITGAVDSSMRIEGTPLDIDKAVIKIYITADVPAGVGDKGVFGNQMKTVFGRVMSGENKTESGEVIDAVFGSHGISKRMCNSPITMGTTNTLLKLISKRAVEIYKGK